MISQAEAERRRERTERTLGRRLLEAFLLVRAGVVLSKLEQAILARDLETAVQVVGLQQVENALAEVQQELGAVRQVGWEHGLVGLPKEITRLPVPQVTLGAAANQRPDLFRAIAEQDFSRIRGITAETQEAIRNALRRGFEAGTDPRVVAREVRGLVGLNQQQEAALAKFRDALIGEGRAPDQIDRMVARKSQALLNLRARTIATNETLRALSEGRRLQWERLASDQVIEPDQYEQEWVTAMDDRTCPICEPLNGQRAPIGSPFVTGVGLLDGPPAHVNCRCVTRATLRNFRKGERPAPARDRILEALGLG